MKHNESDVVFDIKNPKILGGATLAKEPTVFPYYAGYASSFAKHTLSSMQLPSGAFVVDPWNGSGTTTLAAASVGVNALGFDLNPVMVMAAKAALLGESEKTDLIEVARNLIFESRDLNLQLIEEPLETWLFPSSARVIRQIETAINITFVGNAEYLSVFKTETINSVLALAAFLYICLFRSVRKLLLDFVPTNPTWVKHPQSRRNRKRPSREVVEQGFLNEVAHLIDYLPANSFNEKNLNSINIKMGDAKDIPLASRTVDAILTSPPYCTRIDYAIATSIELAVMRCTKNDFSVIRRSLMGNSTVEKNPFVTSLDWGEACLDFLNNLYNHPSQASKTYYYKIHVQYFWALKKSIDEVSRVLKIGGSAIFVVQDSYYKEIHNNIANIVIEMASFSGLELLRRKDFIKSNSMSVINSRAKKYLPKRQTVETVLVFKLNQF